MTEHVTVVGVTAWGLTLSCLFARAGSSVTLLARTETEASTVRRLRTDPRRIAELLLPPSVAITADAAAAFADTGVAVMAVPAQSLRANLGPIRPLLINSELVVSAAKGVELDTGLRMTEVLAEALDDEPMICVLSGPNLAGEIARGLPATTVVAGPAQAAVRVQRSLASPDFRVYTHDDVVGVELGGALKNIIALAAGIGDGLAYGDNAKAALITRGLAEITRLGVALGAQPATFAGLSGLGDVIATCASPLSRNRRVGEALGRGRPLEATLAELDHVAEGVTTTSAAAALARRIGVDLPITFGLERVLRGEITPAAGARLLMEREPKREFDWNVGSGAAQTA
ncbi:MAG: NAD(P)H-dependent glycerol-3-phosphate dehydrogenase [Dehalococcoidia bacterium]